MLKVNELAKAIREIHSGYSRNLVVVAEGVANAEAVAACKRADVIFCCVDNDAARLATALIATSYLKVLIDIATGIHFQPQDNPPEINQKSAIQTTLIGETRKMGADVRLIIPGDGCLLCRGNLSNYAAAVEDLCNHRPVSIKRDPALWRRERAGSLRSLNQIAAGLGIRMLEDLVAGHMRRSTWARLEFAGDGCLSIDYPAARQIPDCPLCARAGSGDSL